MSTSILINGNTYPDVDEIRVPNVGKGTARYTFEEVEGLFTNHADPTSDDWLAGHRISSGGIVEQVGKDVSNIIPCRQNDVIRIKGVIPIAESDRLGIVSASGVLFGLAYFSALPIDGSYEFSIEDGVYTIKILQECVGFRFAMTPPENVNNIIVTVNEEIPDWAGGMEDVVSINTLLSGNLAGEYTNNEITTLGVSLMYLDGLTGLRFDNASLKSGRESFSTNSYMQYFLMPNNVTALNANNGAFYPADSMIKCDLGKTPSLGASVFRHNESCKAYIFRKTTGVVELSSATSSGTLSYIFGYSELLKNDASLGYFIYVPASLVSAYQTDANWGIFSNCYRAIEDYPEICDWTHPDWTPTRV